MSGSKMFDLVDKWLRIKWADGHDGVVGCHQLSLRGDRNRIRQYSDDGQWAYNLAGRAALR